jgi:TalC/MipB family fructose-6-phosphate aldolase
MESNSRGGSNMKIFLDSLDTNQIKKYSRMGLLSGITTNPTFSKRFGMSNDIEMVKKIRLALGKGEIHVEAFGDSKDKIVTNARRLKNETDDNDLVFKIPFSEEGIAASKELIDEGSKTNLHLVYSINQALLAAVVKATYVCPLIGRLDDVGHDATKNVIRMKESFREQSESTLIMASSIRHPQHVLRAYESGIDAITIPPSVLSQMFYHPLTDNGVSIFKNDVEAIKLISSCDINSDLVVKETDTIFYCLSLMAMHKSGAVVILSEESRLLGIFTAGDLKRLVLDGKTLTNNEVVGRYMVRNPISINSNETLSDAKEMMRKFGIDHLVVMNDELVLGILDTKEILF